MGKLTGIIGGGKNRKATFGGRPIGVGESVGDRKLVDIQPNYVMLGGSGGIEKIPICE